MQYFRCIGCSAVEDWHYCRGVLHSLSDVTIHDAYVIKLHVSLVLPAHLHNEHATTRNVPHIQFP